MIRLFIAAILYINLLCNGINTDEKFLLNGKTYTETDDTKNCKSNRSIDKNVLFVVSHSKSPNLVIYKANFATPNSLDSKKPIDVFWVLKTKGNKVEDLTFIEWKMAFGFKLTTVKKEEKYKILLNAIDNKYIYVNKNKFGNFDCFISINNKNIQLKEVFIKFEYSLLGPDVEFLDFKGIDPKTGKSITQRYYA